MAYDQKARLPWMDYCRHYQWSYMPCSYFCSSGGIVNDFILPGDIEKLASKTAGDIAGGWSMLEKICRLKQYPLDIAYNTVHAYIASGLFELEALRKVYHEVHRS